MTSYHLPRDDAQGAPGPNVSRQMDSTPVLLATSEPVWGEGGDEDDEELAEGAKE